MHGLKCGRAQGSRSKPYKREHGTSAVLSPNVMPRVRQLTGPSRIMYGKHTADGPANDKLALVAASTMEDAGAEAGDRPAHDRGNGVACVSSARTVCFHIIRNLETMHD